MRTLLSVWMFVLVSTGCAVGAGGDLDPVFSGHIDPTIAAERNRGPFAFQTLRWCGGRGLLAFDRHETWSARLAAAERIPKPIRVTESVPRDVLDRLDASQLAQR